MLDPFAKLDKVIIERFITEDLVMWVIMPFFGIFKISIEVIDIEFDSLIGRSRQNRVEIFCFLQLLDLKLQVFRQVSPELRCLFDLLRAICKHSVEVDNALDEITDLRSHELVRAVS